MRREDLYSGVCQKYTATQMNNGHLTAEKNEVYCLPTGKYLRQGWGRCDVSFFARILE